MNEQRCLDCEELLENIDEITAVGDVVECELCGAEMEAVEIDPIVLRLIEEEK